MHKIDCHSLMYSRYVYVVVCKIRISLAIPISARLTTEGDLSEIHGLTITALTGGRLYRQYSSLQSPLVLTLINAVGSLEGQRNVRSRLVDCLGEKRAAGVYILDRRSSHSVK